MKARVLFLVFALGLAAVSPGATPNAAKLFGTAVADAVDKVMPSVVVVRTAEVKYYIERDYFRGRAYRVPERLMGQGSGVVISKDGYILTNHHVVEGAQRIQVAFSDGKQFEARVIGSDPHTDLAVIKIEHAEGREFKAVQAGDSDAIRIGEFVIAVGSPFSLSSSVTLGIVSQKGRAIGMLPYEDFIQTDAAVNKGNSGGPLLDVDGHMVGINSVIQTSGDSEGSIGISFAIPGNLAMAVSRSLIKHGKWQRPWIGVSMNESDRRVTVGGIADGGPAAKAGLLENDVILSVDDTKVETAHDVQRVILQKGVGEKIELKILRGGKEQAVSIPTVAMPARAMREE